jgi:hypothetical protein
MPTAESRVATVLRISEAEAQRFIRQVRALLSAPPNDVWIARCLEEYPHLPHTPDAVAAKMKALGWVSPARRERKERQPSSKAKQGNQSRARTGGAQQPSSRRQGYRRWRQPPPTWNDPTDAAPDPFDPARVPLGRLDKCPHGVPLTHVCAICNPEKFKQRGDVE